MITEEEVLRQENLAKAEFAENKAKVATFIGQFTAYALNVSYDDNACYGSKPDVGISVDFKGTKDERVFGASFDIKYRGEYDFVTREYSEPELFMGCGSTGIESRKSAPYQVARCHLMSKLWDHETQFRELLNSLDHTAAKAYRELNRQYEREQRELETTAYTKLLEDVKSKAKVGYTFSEDKVVDRWNSDTCCYEPQTEYTIHYEITKITPKRAYLKCNWTVLNQTQSIRDDNWNWIGTAYGHEDKQQSGYIQLNRLYRHLASIVKNEGDNTVLSCLEGLSVIRYNFVEERRELDSEK